MRLIEQVKNCTTEEAYSLITNAITQLNETSLKVEQLGFLNGSTKFTPIFKGFIPIDTRIKYSNFSVETYGMQTTDYFYEFADFIKKYNINVTSNFNIIMNLEYFINEYFGYPNKTKRREDIFNKLAWETTKTDEEYFTALQNNKIGDLKGLGVAECTERSALAQQILSLSDIESYYCIGCVQRDERQEEHCFNIVKRKNDYALLDYSLPVTSYNKEGKINAFYPYVGVMTNDEFQEFSEKGILKRFPNYEYREGKQNLLKGERAYIVGKTTILQQEKPNIEKQQ